MKGAPPFMLLPVQLLLGDTAAPSEVKLLEEGVLGILDVGRACCCCSCAPCSCAEAAAALLMLLLLLFGLTGRTLAAKGAILTVLATERAGIVRV
jgi:hypothetical protein